MNRGSSITPESDSHDDLGEFTPLSRWLHNAHLQTLVGNFTRRQHVLPPSTKEIVEVEAASAGLPASYVLCECHWQHEDVRADRLTVVLVHGLEGSSNSHYVLGNADKAWHAGMNVVRMNMRSCGAGETLSPTIYHCGRSGDVGRVVEHCVARYGIRRFALVGYSMGGNLVLRYAGLSGAGIAPQVAAVVGVSPLTDLAPSSAALHEPQNRVYEWKFLRDMLARFRRKVAMFPDVYSLDAAKGISSMRAFDHRIVARYGPFDGADGYYATCSAGDVADRITVPTLVLHSLDDPFIRMSAATREKMLANPHIRLIETEHGGHCAFLGPAEDVDEARSDNFWAERTLLRFLQRYA